MPVDLLAFVEHRSRAGVKSATVRHDLCVLRTLYGYLFTHRLVNVNPAASLPEMICAPVKEKAFLTVEECFQLLEAADTSTAIGLRSYVILALLWSVGLRNRELCTLTWQDVDLEQGTLLVRHGKGGKQRQLFLNERVLDDLSAWHRKVDGAGSSPVFFAMGRGQVPPQGERAPLSASRLVETVREHARSAGLDKPVNPLTFRHTFATHMFEAGATMDEIKELLGHDDETESTIYVHVTLDAAKQLLNDHVANPTLHVPRR